MIDFDVLGDNIREFFSQRQKALLISCVLIVFFCAALLAIIFIPQKKAVPSARFKSEPLTADQELLLPQGVSMPQEYSVSRQTPEKWDSPEIQEWLVIPDQETVKKLSASNDSLIKSITEAAP